MQRERDNKEVRNDRYIGIPEVSLLYKGISEINELPEDLLQQIENFFINYNAQAGKRFTPQKRIDSQRAMGAIEKTRNSPEPNRLIQLLLPRYDNKNREFPQRLYNAVNKKLIKEFGGVTAYTQSPAIGLWRSKNDDLEKDTVIVYEVMTSKIDRSFWKKYKFKLAQKFGQEAITIRQIEMGLL